MKNTTMAFAPTCTSPSYGGRTGGVLARRALVGVVTLAILPWVPLAHAASHSDRRPVVRSQVLQAAPAGYRQLEIPAAYLGALTPRSRTLEFRLTYGGRPATLAVTRNEKGQLVNAFASGALPLDRLPSGTAAGTPPSRARITSQKEFWDRYSQMKHDCLEYCKNKYPNNAKKQMACNEDCIDEGIFNLLGELIVSQF